MEKSTLGLNQLKHLWFQLPMWILSRADISDWKKCTEFGCDKTNNNEV